MKAYLLLGSNLGDRAGLLAQAREGISLQAGKIQALSSVYETASWGKTQQPPFLNQAVEVSTELSPRELLDCLHSIENAIGRTRGERWASRTIDIDILFAGNEALAEKDLTIPHPLMQVRRFTLVPLAEIAGDFIHPVLKKTVKQLLAECNDQSKVVVSSQ